MHSNKQLSFLPSRKIIQFSRELTGSARGSERLRWDQRLKRATGGGERVMSGMWAVERSVSRGSRARLEAPATGWFISVNRVARWYRYGGEVGGRPPPSALRPRVKCTENARWCPVLSRPDHARRISMLRPRGAPRHTWRTSCADAFPPARVPPSSFRFISRLWRAKNLWKKKSLSLSLFDIVIYTVSCIQTFSLSRDRYVPQLVLRYANVAHPCSRLLARVFAIDLGVDYSCRSE